MSKFMDSNIENDYGQFVMIQHDNEYDFPEVRNYYLRVGGNFGYQ